MMYEEKRREKETKKEHVASTIALSKSRCTFVYLLFLTFSHLPSPPLFPFSSIMFKEREEKEKERKSMLQAQ
jgi:hypothetical protein